MGKITKAIKEAKDDEVAFVAGHRYHSPEYQLGSVFNKVEIHLSDWSKLHMENIAFAEEQKIHIHGLLKQVTQYVDEYFEEHRRATSIPFLISPSAAYLASSRRLVYSNALFQKNDPVKSVEKPSEIVSKLIAAELLKLKDLIEELYRKPKSLSYYVVLKKDTFVIREKIFEIVEQFDELEDLPEIKISFIPAGIEHGIDSDCKVF